MESTGKWFPPSRRRIFLLRHGDVSYFDQEGRPHRPGSVALNDEGRQQAQAAAEVLTPVCFDRVLSSDLVRSTQTATIVSAGRGLTVETSPELREIQPGRLADIPTTSLEQAFLGAFSGKIDRATCFLAGESFGSLVDRVQAYFQKVLADLQWQRLLIVAHGGVNRTILAYALGLDLAGFGALEQDPCCINIIDVDNAGRCLVRLVNYTPYNPAKMGLELTTMERLYLQYRQPGGP